MLPVEFALFGSLTNLDLSGNAFTEPPLVLQHLKNLKELNLSHNQLISLPHFLFPKIPLIDLSFNLRKPMKGSNAIFGSQRMNGRELAPIKCKHMCVCVGRVAGGEKICD